MKVRLPPRERRGFFVLSDPDASSVGVAYAGSGGSLRFSDRVLLDSHGYLCAVADCVSACRLIDGWRVSSREAEFDTDRQKFRVGDQCPIELVDFVCAARIAKVAFRQVCERVAIGDVMGGRHYVRFVIERRQTARGRDDRCNRPQGTVGIDFCGKPIGEPGYECRRRRGGSPMVRSIRIGTGCRCPLAGRTGGRESIAGSRACGDGALFRRECRCVG